MTEHQSEMELTLNEKLIKDRDLFKDRLMRSALGVFDWFAIYLGDKLGLYDALVANGSMTALELSLATKTHSRYIQEWLEQQAVSGILNVEDDSLSASSLKFFVPIAHREILTERDSPNYLAPMGRLLAGVVKPLPQILDAYRSGCGIPFVDYGEDLCNGLADTNRAMFLSGMGLWLGSILELDKRLNNSNCFVADIGCGAGWSSIAIATHYPKVKVHGFDIDESSVKMAKSNATVFDIAERVDFFIKDIETTMPNRSYDLIIAFESIHDMPNPLAALQNMRKMAGEDGIVIVVDANVGQHFSSEGFGVEWMMYGWSIFHCLPVSMCQHPSAAIGAVIRPQTIKTYSLNAGFSDVRILPIANPMFNFYHLVL
jgi:2-polyprenyl-3-methyl-5-hydroxy-6-metoxy-1,4-benzoquinol methylase